MKVPSKRQDLVAVHLIILYILVLFLSLAGNSRCLSWVRHSSRKSSATHSCQCVQHFRVSKQWYGCQCLGFFNVHTDVDTYDCTRGLYGDTVRESALEADWEKNPLPQTPTRFSIAPWVFSRTICQQSYSRLSTTLTTFPHNSHVTSVLALDS